MSVKVLPTLTYNGFIDDVDEMLNRIYFYYVTSDYTQSITFFGEIKSLQYALKRADYKPDRSTEEVKQDLITILHRYFTNLDADSIIVDYKEKTTGTDKVIYVIGIDLEVVDNNGKKHQLSKSIELDENDKLHFGEGLDYLNYFAENKQYI